MIETESSDYTDLSNIVDEDEESTTSIGSDTGSESTAN